MEVYPNLGPITDFCLYDLNKLGRVVNMYILKNIKQ